MTRTALAVMSNLQSEQQKAERDLKQVTRNHPPLIGWDTFRMLAVKARAYALNEINSLQLNCKWETWGPDSSVCH